MAVLGTVAIWYFGDALYNDYSQMMSQFTDDVLALAWWQVVWFMGAFSFFVPRIHLSMNRRSSDEKARSCASWLGGKSKIRPSRT